MTTIFHLTTRPAWTQAAQDGVYRAESLASQGYIHLSTREQIVGVANRFYRGVPDLVLLAVDPARLTADLRYEPPAEAPDSDERFPHLYGALNLDAVMRIIDFPPDADGTWRTPPTES